MASLVSAVSAQEVPTSEYIVYRGISGPEIRTAIHILQNVVRLPREIAALIHSYTTTPLFSITRVNAAGERVMFSVREGNRVNYNAIPVERPWSATLADDSSEHASIRGESTLFPPPFNTTWADVQKNSYRNTVFTLAGLCTRDMTYNANFTDYTLQVANASTMTLVRTITLGSTFETGTYFRICFWRAHGYGGVRFDALGNGTGAYSSLGFVRFSRGGNEIVPFRSPMGITMYNFCYGRGGELLNLPHVAQRVSVMPVTRLRRVSHESERHHVFDQCEGDGENTILLNMEPAPYPEPVATKPGFSCLVS